MITRIYSLRIYFFMVFAIFTASCTTAPEPVTTHPITDLYKRTSWQAKGKLALRIGDKSQSANFSWRQNTFDFVIHLYGPLGQGSVYISKKGALYTLKSKDGTLEADSAEALMYQANGWSIPVSNLIFWLRGLPAPKTPMQASSFYSSGALKTLKQNDWVMQFNSHHETQGYILPKKMKATRDNLKLTLFVKSWSIKK